MASFSTLPKYFFPSLKIVLLVALCAVTLMGVSCRREPLAQREKPPLVVWGLWQETTQMQPITKAFEQQTGQKVEYKKIASLVDYERSLLEALARGQGPDVFVIHHTWVESKRGLMAPAPQEVVDTRNVQEEFVDVVTQDLVRDGKIYGLPTSVDTLALYYNKDILGAAGVATPPRTWETLQQVVQDITKLTPTGDIEQSGVALGTGSNINRSGDIVQLLMAQSGLPIADPKTGLTKMNNAEGIRALSFYTDFANRNKTTYTWNLQEDFSVDAFAQGKTAMMVNYAYQQGTVKAKNPRLSFGISAVPQIADSKVVNFASYWPFAVSVNSKQPLEAWQFVRFLTNQDMSSRLNKAQNLPPARRDAIALAAREPLLGVFAEQALTAITWPRVDIAATDTIFITMIDSVVTGATTIPTALQTAETRLNQLRRDFQDRVQNPVNPSASP